MTTDYTALSDEDLEAKMQELMAARAEAEAPFKAEQQAITAEVDRRAVTARVDKALEGVPEEQRVAVLETLRGG